MIVNICYIKMAYLKKKMANIALYFEKIRLIESELQKSPKTLKISDFYDKIIALEGNPAKFSEH